MTSGTVYPVGLFEELGVFMEELFVWGIDCEYCWRAARKGVRTVCFKNILLQHDLGYQKKKHRLLGKEVFRTSIRRHVLITMCAMAWYFTDSILRA